MKRFYYLLLCCLSCIGLQASILSESSRFSSGESASESKGIFLPSVSSIYSGALQVRTDDLLLGSHDDGNDQRSKAFTISARVWIDEVSSGQLSYTTMPLFGLTAAEAYGINTMADVFIHNGTYTTRVNTSNAGTSIVPDESIQNFPVRMNEWVHLTMTVDDVNGEVSLYCDGELSSVTHYAGKGNVIRSDEDAVFHFTNYLSYASLGVRYDELKIADRVLSADEIKSMKYAYPLDQVPDYIVGYYNFDETTGTVNEYPNYGHGGDCKMQVVKGMPDYSGMNFHPSLHTEDCSCTGYENIYPDKEEFEVTVEISGEGTVVLKDFSMAEYESGQKFPKDSTVWIVATPADDYQLTSISVNGTALTDLKNPSFQVTEPTKVQVVFDLKGALVSVAGDDIIGGTYICVNPSTGIEYPKNSDQTYYDIPYQSKVMIKGIADEGYKLKSITLLEEGVEIPFDLADPVFEVNAGLYEIQMEFIARYSVNYSAGEGGTLSVTADGTKVANGKVLDAGTELLITPVPDEGYKVDQVTVNGESLSAAEETFTLILEENVSISASFEKIVGIEEIGANSLVTYNPDLDQIVLSESLGQITVYASDGAVLLQSFGSAVSMSSLESGVYVAVVEVNGQKIVFKFVK